MSKKKRPHIQEETSDIKARIPAEHRSMIERLAEAHNVFASAVFRDALDYYLARPEIQEELQALSNRTNLPTT